VKGYLQQGDVIFHRADIPKSATEKIKSLVVQEGEHTGHAHRLMFRHGEGTAGARCEILRDPKTGERYLSIEKEPVNLSHEEHKTFAIPPGEYRIGIVQEYDHFAEEARQVQD